MFGRNFLSKETIRFFCELIHRDADDSSAAFMRAAAGGFHHTGIPAGADREAGVGQQFANLQRLRIFRIAFATFGPAKDSDDSFAHTLSLVFRPYAIAV